MELLDSESEVTIEVACYDLGEFARFHPEGRRCVCVCMWFQLCVFRVITRLGGKRKLMAQMHHKNAKIAKQALLSVQKLMVNNWSVFFN